MVIRIFTISEMMCGHFIVVDVHMFGFLIWIGISIIDGVENLAKLKTVVQESKKRYSTFNL